MGTTEEASEVEILNEMFKDRFTESDTVYTSIKSIKLPPPPVVHPWKTQKDKNFFGEGRRPQNRYSQRGNYQDRSGNGESSSRHQYHSRERNDRDSYRERSNDRDSNRNRGSHEDHRNSYRRDNRR